MKIKNLLAAMVTLSFAAPADEPENLSWPIADPFAAFAATSAAAERAAISTRVTESLVDGARIFGTPSPFLAAFRRRAGEPFLDLLARAADAASMKTGDLARMTLRDRSGIEIGFFDFKPENRSGLSLEFSLHGALHVPYAALVPIDVPDRFRIHRSFVWAPTFEIQTERPALFLAPTRMDARQIVARDGRIYFPWILVGDDWSALAVEVTDWAEPDGPTRYLSATTTGRDRGRVRESSQPPRWWPTGEPQIPTLSERLTK